MIENTAQFKKNFIWNILGTGLNAFNSLFFMIMVTRINGTTDAGIFTLAYSTACILYIIGVYAGRIFQVTEKGCINDKEFIVNRIITATLMVVISIGFVIVKKYEPYKASVFVIICFYKALEAFSDVLYGILQKSDLLYKVGKSFFYKAILSLIMFFIIDKILLNMIVASIMIVLANLLFIIIYDIPNILKIIDQKQKIKMKNVFSMYKSGFFIFAISFLSLYVMNAPKYAIDDYLNEHIQAIYGIIIMPATVVGLFAQFIIHPYLNSISNLYQNNDIKQMKKIVTQIITIIIILGFICIVLAYLLGIPVLELLYGIELNEYRINLVCILFAATLSTIGTIYSSVLTTIRKTFIQFIIYFINTVIAIISSYILTYNFGINGATIAYLIIMALQFVLYCIITNIIIHTISKEKKYET